MKQIIIFMLAVFWGACFAEPSSQAEQVSESYQEVSLSAYHSDSAMFADSAAYYEELAARYKKEADYLLKSSSKQVKIGAVLTLLGAVGTLAVFRMAKGASIEGGGAIIVFPAALTVGTLTAGAVMLSINGVRDGNARRKIQKSERYQKKAEAFREEAWKSRYQRTSQMMLQIVPEIDFVNKTIGARLALGI